MYANVQATFHHIIRLTTITTTTRINKRMCSMEEKVNYVNYILFYGRKIACLYDNFIHILSVFNVLFYNFIYVLITIIIIIFFF